MREFVCSFFGHRKICVTEELQVKVKETIKNLINSYNVKVFLFGSRSDFDSLCHNIVTELKNTYPDLKRIIYTCKSETCVYESERLELERIYSKVLNQEVHLLCYDEEFEHKTKYSSGKASYIERNYAMIDNSDFCMFYYDENYLPEMRKYSKSSVVFYQPKSGTALAFTYAKQKKKNIINVFEK